MLEKRITAFICNSNLEGIAVRERIHRLLRIYFPRGFPTRQHVLATTVKALVGAVWLDSKKNRAAIRKLLDRLLGTTLELENKK